MFEFRDQGAAWGLVALDQAVTRPPLLASVDAAIKIWQVFTGKQLGTLTGHIEEATDVSFSPDGRTLASIGVLTSVKLWHVATFREVLSLDFPRAGFHLQFSPDGRHLAVAIGRNENEAIQLLSTPLTPQ